jgi:hypothetical protein
MPTSFGEEKMMNSLMDSFSICHEPEIDYSQRPGDRTLDASLLGHFSKRGVLRRFARFNMTLWKRPERASALVPAPDQETSMSI